MVKSSTYWKQRFDQVEQAANNQSVAYMQSLEKKYRKATQEIDSKINAWYQRLADNNGVSLTEAKRMLNHSESAEFKWSVEQYIKAGRENALDQRWMKELENASARFHINRLEALKLEARHQIELATGGIVDDVDGLLKSVYSDTFYRSCFEIQKGVGVGFDVSRLDDGLVSRLLSKPWSVDGTNFSEKLWGNKAKLINTLDRELSRMVLTGGSPRKAIANISKAMRVSVSAARRLVLTEQAYFTSIAQKDAYNELAVEEYEFVGTLDSDTCSDCGELDGQHFLLKDMQPGVNAPPMHPYCRCTTCPYFEDEFTVSERAARGEDGKTYYVPEKMMYKQWKESFVDGGSKADLTSVVSDGTMTDIDKKAILDYMSAKSYIVNEKLRTGVTLSDDEQEFITKLDVALSKMPTYEGNLQRSLFFYSDEDVKLFLEEYKKGNSLKYNEFISTTKGEVYNPDGQVQMYIQNAKKGKDISSLNKGENEVLYERNTLFKVINTVEKDGKYYILMEEADAE